MRITEVANTQLAAVPGTVQYLMYVQGLLAVSAKLCETVSNFLPFYLSICNTLELSNHISIIIFNYFRVFIILFLSFTLPKNYFCLPRGVSPRGVTSGNSVVSMIPAGSLNLPVVAIAGSAALGATAGYAQVDFLEIAETP